MQKLKTEIRDKLLEEAKRTFLEYDFKNASMRAIASSSGVTVGNVYRYFHGKDDLFHAVVGDAYSAIMDIINMKRSSSLDLQNVDPKINVGEILADDVLSDIVEIFIVYRQEIHILLNCAGGSRFENVRDELEDLITSKILDEVFLRKKTDLIDLEIFSRTLAIACIAGISKFCNSDMNTDDMKKNIYGLILFLFNGAKARVSVMENTFEGGDYV